MSNLAEDPFEKYVKHGPHDAELMKAAYLPPRMTPEREIEQTLDLVHEGLERVQELVDTNIADVNMLLGQALTLIERLQRKLS